MVDSQAQARLRPALTSLGPVPTGLGEETTLDSVRVTAYERVAVLERPPWGTVRRLSDGDVPSDPQAEYHLAFRQVDEPVAMVDLPLNALLDGRGQRHAGWDVQPALAAAAEQYRFRAVPGVDQLLTARGNFELVRFTPAEGEEVWLSWDGTSRSWELAHDPRSVYPGAASDVIDADGFTDPRPVLTVDDPQDGVPRTVDLTGPEPDPPFTDL